MTQFSSFDLSKPLLDAVASEGYDTPTPIQAQAIPAILDGRDLLGCAQTGTGKTAAFALPILELLHRGSKNAPKKQRRRPRVLILSPTRELAVQIEESMRTYGKKTHMRHTVIYGGVSQYRQVRQLDAGVDIIVATPGRLMDLMEQGYVDLGAVEIFVLDEADRMLDMGFINPIRDIAKQIPANHQTLLFSATMPSTIKKLANTLLSNPLQISITPDIAAAPSIDQWLFMIPGTKKAELLSHLLGDERVERAVVFTRTKHGADKLVSALSRNKIDGVAIHGNKSQNQRQRALDSFRSGRSRVLVATDVAARGLDVDGITHVFNYDLPNEAEAYVHRIGRTGRAGAKGTAISFCGREERAFLRAIERLTGEQIETIDVPESIVITKEDLATFEPIRQGGRPQRSGNGGSRGGSSNSRGPKNQGRSQRAGTGKKKGSANANGKPKRGRKPAMSGQGR